MADHARKQIRDAVEAVLIHNTSVKERVFASRGKRLAEKELPAIVILTPNDPTSTTDKDGRYLHDLNLLVVCADGAAKDEVQDDLDALAVEVEGLIGVAIPNIKTLYEELVGTDFDQSPEGAEQFAFLSMRFLVRYHTMAGAPDVIVN